MPVSFRRLDAGIYAVHLQGEISLEELVSAQQRGLATAQNEGERAYVLVIEVERDTQMPFDIRQAGQLIENDRSIAVLSVGVTLYMKFIVSVLARLFGLGTVEHHRTLEDAEKRGRELLQAHHARSIHPSE